MSGEKTHAPTPKKLKDARDKGQVAQSKEIPVLAKLLAFFPAFLLAFPLIWSHVQDLMDTLLLLSVRQQGRLWFALSHDALRLCLILVVSFCGLISLASLAACFAQVGILFAPEAAKPSFAKLNAIQNVAQMFSLQSLLTFFLSVLKVALYGWMTVHFLSGIQDDILKVGLLELEEGRRLLFHHLSVFLMWSFGLLLTFAAGDWALSRFFHRRKLRMSHQDMVDEYKNMEGDPHVKGQRKQLHRSLLEGSLNKVRQAKVVVNNPTHISVALDYEPGVHDLPLILVMDSDEGAMLIRQEALLHGIPMITNRELARGLFADGQEGQYIPSRHVAMAAEVFRQLMEAFEAIGDSEENTDAEAPASSAPSEPPHKGEPED